MVSVASVGKGQGMAVMTWDGTERRERGIGNRARRAIITAFLVTYRRQWEVGIGWILLVSGVWLILPMQTFTGSSGYAWLTEIQLPEWAVGLGLLAVGLFGLVSGLRGTRRVRSAALLAMVGANVFLSVAFFMGNPASLGAAAFAALATIAAVAVVYVEWAAQWTSPQGS